MSPEADLRTMRLQRFLARAGVASRRKSEDLMTAGRVAVNGVVVRELGSKVCPATDVVTVDGVIRRLGEGHAYLMLHKPRGYLTTMHDQRGRPCVARLVPLDRHPGLYPVGRLDADTTGLLLFTTNGDVGQALLHPARHVWKHYVALVRGVPDGPALSRLARGVRLDDGLARPARDVTLLAEGEPQAAPVIPEGMPYGHAVVGLSIHEGRKHQVKRMLAAIGHEVVRLHRDGFGPLVLSGVAPGCWRTLDERERTSVEAAAGLAWSPEEEAPPSAGGAIAGGRNL